jgi:hypothetical protein
MLEPQTATPIRGEASMSKIAVLAGLLSISVSLSAFGQMTTGPETTMRQPRERTMGMAGTSAHAIQGARIRVINASNQPVSLRAGAQALGQTVAPGQTTQWQAAPAADDQKLQVVDAGGAELADNASFEVDADNKQDVTVLVTRPKDEDETKAKVTVFKVDRDPEGPTSESGNIKVTLINAATDVDAADLFVGSKKVHAGVNYAAKNGPDEVDAGPLRVVDGKNERNIPLDNSAVQPGAAATVVVLSATEAKLLDDSGAGAALTGVRPGAGTASSMDRPVRTTRVTTGTPNM